MINLTAEEIKLLRRLNKEGYLALYFDKAVKGGPHEALIKAGYARQVGGFLVASGLGFKAEEDLGRNVLTRTYEAKC